MSMFIQPTSSSATVQSAGLLPNAGVLPDEQGDSEMPSFGEVLVRQLAPDAEGAETPVARKTVPAPGRRQTRDAKTETPDQVNEMALAPPTPEISVIRAATARNAQASSALTLATPEGAERSALQTILDQGTATTAVTGPGTAATALADKLALQRRGWLQELFAAKQNDPPALMAAMTRLGVSAAELAAAMDHKVDINDWLKLNGAAVSSAMAQPGMQSELRRMSPGTDQPADNRNDGSSRLLQARAAAALAGELPAQVADRLSNSPPASTAGAAVTATSDEAVALAAVMQKPAGPTDLQALLDASPAIATNDAIPLPADLAAHDLTPFGLSLSKPLEPSQRPTDSTITHPNQAARTRSAEDKPGLTDSEAAPAKGNPTPFGLSLSKPLEPSLRPTETTSAQPNQAAWTRSTQDKPGLTEIAVPAPTGPRPDEDVPASVDTPLGDMTASNSGTALPATVSPNSAFLINPGSAAGAQATAAANSGSDATPTRAVLSPEVGSQEWNKALGQHMVHMTSAGHQVTELQLNPPGLGPLKVTLDMNDHQMQLMFVSTHASVRAAVEAAMPQLRATLADSGISLGSTSVSAEHQPQAAFAQGQSAAQQQHRAYRSHSAAQPPVAEARTVPETRRRNNGINVDTYA